MIQQIERLLKRWGYMRPYSDDEMINASIEDKVRETDKVLGRLQESLTRRFTINERLRETLRVAKHRTNSFEAFEKHVIGRIDRQ